VNGELVKKETSKPIDQDMAHSDRDMCPEYDFASMSGGVRGKYYKAYRAGHTVRNYVALLSPSPNGEK